MEWTYSADRRLIDEPLPLVSSGARLSFGDGGGHHS